jgi:hypothetical protein
MPLPFGTLAVRQSRAEWVLVGVENGLFCIDGLPGAGLPAPVSSVVQTTCASSSNSLSAHLKHVSRPPALGTLDAVDLQALELGDQFS